MDRETVKTYHDKHWNEIIPWVNRISWDQFFNAILNDTEKEYIEVELKNLLKKIYFSNPTWAAEAIKKFSTYDVEGHGYISPKFFIEYVTELPLERALQKENPTPKEVRARADRGTE